MSGSCGNIVTHFDLCSSCNGLIRFSKQLRHNLLFEIGLAAGITHPSGNLLDDNGHSAPFKRHGRMAGAQPSALAKNATTLLFHVIAYRLVLVL